MDISIIGKIDEQKPVIIPFPSTRRERLRRIFDTNKCGISAFTCRVKAKDSADEIEISIKDCDPIFSNRIVFKPRLLRIFSKDTVIVCLKKNHDQTFKKLQDSTTREEINFHKLYSSHGVKFVIEIELDKITELQYKRLKR